MNRSTHFKPKPQPQSSLKAIRQQKPHRPTITPQKQQQVSPSFCFSDKCRSLLKRCTINQGQSALVQRRHSNYPQRQKSEVLCQDSRKSKKQIKTNEEQHTIYTPNKETFANNNNFLSSEYDMVKESAHTQTETIILKPVKYYKACKTEVIDYCSMTPIGLQKHKQKFKMVELTNMIGAGANANVRLGTEKSTGRKVAVKIYEKYKMQQQWQKKRVLKEIEILLSLNHPNVIQLLGAYEDKRQIHMVLQYIENGVTLQDYLRLKKFKLTQSEKEHIGQQVLKGIQYLHQGGVYHRDIKTDNILMTGGGTLKMIDFGFATNCRQGGLSCGTPHFMAPQLFVKGQYDAEKVDAWAYGVLLYYLHQYQYPFKGYNQKEITRNIRSGKYCFKNTPFNMQNLIDKLLCLPAEERICCRSILFNDHIM